jgi:hypothetical protein
MKIGPYELSSLTVGDSRELAKAIPDESIDLIFTDPPYPKKYLPLYGWLAETAARVLKPGGFLCAMAGGYYLDKVFEQMSGKGLRWYFKVELFNGGNKCTVVFPRRMVTRTKPILMWTKGKGKIQIWQMTDVYKGQGPDKRFHEWGQEEGSARYCIDYIVGASHKAMLWEPFAGGGATLVACKALGVDYIAFEQDPQAAAKASARLEGVECVSDVERVAMAPAPQRALFVA